jgi:hypothetical protein
MLYLADVAQQNQIRAFWLDGELCIRRVDLWRLQVKIGHDLKFDTTHVL